MPGFSFLDLNKNVLNQRHSGLRSFFGDIAQSITDKLVARAKLPSRARAELYVYLLNMPSPDYHVWQRIYMKIRDAVQGWDQTKEVRFFSLYPHLDFCNTASPTTEQQVKALFETVKRYILAAHEVVGWVANVLTWFNIDRHPISSRIRNAFRSSNMRHTLNLLARMPVSNAWIQYLVRELRLLMAYPENSAVVMGLPLFKLPSNLHWDGKAITGNGVPSHHVTPQWTVVPELLSAGMNGDADPSLAEYMTGLGLVSNYGALVSYMYNNLTSAVSNLLSVVGYSSNESMAVESELLEMLTKLGILDSQFDWMDVQKRVNGNGVYSMVDYINKMMLFADRPRTVLRRTVHPWYVCQYPEDSPFDATLGKYISDDVIEDFDHYEYLRANIAHANWPAIAGSGNWDDTAAVVISSIDDSATGIPETGGSLGAYGIHLKRVLKEFWSPYRDWYLPSEDYLDAELSSEEGRFFAVQDEYNAGYFVLRAVITPCRDNTDPFDCGFFYLGSTEMHGKNEAGSWGAWMENYISIHQKTWTGVTAANVWEENHANILDMLVWVGSSVFMKPLQGFRHYLAAQCSWWDRTADDLNPEGAITFVTKVDADRTLSALPFTPFILPYGWPSVQFESGAVNSADEWNVTHGFWTAVDTGVGYKLYDHTQAVSTASRLALWFPWDVWDPIRPHRMRFSNLHLAMMNRYADIIHGAMEDFSTIFTNASIDTIDVTMEASRFISDFMLSANRGKVPITGGGGGATGGPGRNRFRTAPGTGAGNFDYVEFLRRVVSEVAAESWDELKKGNVGRAITSFVKNTEGYAYNTMEDYLRDLGVKPEWQNPLNKLLEEVGQAVEGRKAKRFSEREQGPPKPEKKAVRPPGER